MTTVVPTRQSSPVPSSTVHILQTPSPSPSPVPQRSVRLVKGRRSRASSSSRQRGRSDSLRRVQPIINVPKPANYGRWDSIRDGVAPEPVYSSRKAELSKPLPTAGVNACQKWLTASPPVSWFTVSAEETERRRKIAHETLSVRLPLAVRRAIKETEYALDCTVSEQSLLFLYTQHTTSVYDLDVDDRMLLLDDKIADLAKCLQRLKTLEAELSANKRLKRFGVSADAHWWNDQLVAMAKELGSVPTYATAPTLFVEAYVHRRIAECFAVSTWWGDFDPFKRDKHQSLANSFKDVISLASEYATPVEIPDCLFPDEVKEVIKEQFTKLVRALFRVHHNMDFENILDRLWTTVAKTYEQGNGRVDIVLENAGFELFSDLLFADFLIQSGLALEVRFHGKRMPWFTMDATKSDWEWMLAALVEPTTFSTCTQSERNLLRTLAGRWKSWAESRRFIFEHHAFWTTGYTFWAMPLHASDLFRHLSASQLAIFKGVLNYRRLTYDEAAPQGTPFEEAIGPMGARRGIDFPNVIWLSSASRDV